MKFGYARVSTLEQNLDLQIDALKEAGCEQIITDEISGSVAERKGLSQLKERLRKGDTVVVWRLDRLGRSLKHLLELIHEFEQSGIHFQSLQESINTSSPTGKLIFHLFGALSEFERNLIRERTKAGLQAARSRGKLGGRPKKLTQDKQQRAKDLYNQRQENGKKQISIQEICAALDISKPTLYSYLRS